MSKPGREDYLAAGYAKLGIGLGILAGFLPIHPLVSIMLVVVMAGFGWMHIIKAARLLDVETDEASS